LGNLKPVARTHSWGHYGHWVTVILTHSVLILSAVRVFDCYDKYTVCTSACVIIAITSFVLRMSMLLSVSDHFVTQTISLAPVKKLSLYLMHCNFLHMALLSVIHFTCVYVVYGHVCP